MEEVSGVLVLFFSLLQLHAGFSSDHGVVSQVRMNPKTDGRREGAEECTVDPDHF